MGIFFRKQSDHQVASELRRRIPTQIIMDAIFGSEESSKNAWRAIGELEGLKRFVLSEQAREFLRTHRDEHLFEVAFGAKRTKKES